MKINIHRQIARKCDLSMNHLCPFVKESKLSIMRFIYLIFLFSFLNSGIGTAQNNPPKIQQVSFTIDSSARKAHFHFNLKDSEDATLKVSLLVEEGSNAGTWISPDGLTGDIGDKVAVGPKKSIVWNYAKSSINLQDAGFRIVAEDAYHIPVASIIAEVDSNRLKSRLQSLSIPRDHETEDGLKNLKEVRSLLAQYMKESNVETSAQEFKFGGLDGQNIIGEIKGQVNSHQKIVAFAHYDQVRGSIEDLVNTTGIVGVLEIMQVLSEYQFKNSIIGAHFDMAVYEYIGSNHFVYHGGLSKKDKFLGGFYLDALGSDLLNKAAIPQVILDMVPKPYQSIVTESSTNSFVANIAHQNSMELYPVFQKAAEQYVPELKAFPVEVPGYGEIAFPTQDGDHSAFWYQRLPVLFLTTAGNKSATEEEASDPLKRANIHSMSNIIKATIASIVQMAEPFHGDVYESRFSHTI